MSIMTFINKYNMKISPLEGLKYDLTLHAEGGTSLVPDQNITVDINTIRGINTSIIKSNVNKVYSDPNRHYHNNNHINDMFAKLRIMNDMQTIEELDLTVIAAAIIFHDVVINYHEVSIPNEVLSVKWMLEQYGVSLTDEQLNLYINYVSNKEYNKLPFTGRVAKLILITAYNPFVLAQDASTAERIISLLDYSGFVDDPEVFDTNNKNIKAEALAHGMSEDIFDQKRYLFLASLVDAQNKSKSFSPFPNLTQSVLEEARKAMVESTQRSLKSGSTVVVTKSDPIAVLNLKYSVKIIDNDHVLTGTIAQSINDIIIAFSDLEKKSLTELTIDINNGNPLGALSVDSCDHFNVLMIPAIIALIKLYCKKESFYKLNGLSTFKVQIKRD